MTPAARRSRYQRSTGMLLDVAVAAEQLHAVGADLMPLLAAQRAGERDLAGEVLAAVGAAGGA